MHREQQRSFDINHDLNGGGGGGYCSDSEEKPPQMLLMTSFFNCSLWRTMEHTVESFACLQFSFLELFLVSFLTILCTSYTHSLRSIYLDRHARSQLSTVSAFKTLGKHSKHTDIYIYVLRGGGAVVKHIYTMITLTRSFLPFAFREHFHMTRMMSLQLGLLWISGFVPSMTGLGLTDI